MAGTIIGAIAGPVVSGLVGSAFGGSGSRGAQTAANAADPFAAQRPQYQQQLADLMANPASVTSLPGYQFQLNQAADTVNAGAAASGQLNSGARLAALSKLGAGYASSQYQQQLSNLMQLSGANIGSPGTSGQILANSSNANSAAASTFGNSLVNAATPAVSNWWNNNSSSASGYIDALGLA